MPNENNAPRITTRPRGQMGQEVQKAKDIRGTLARLIRYFTAARRLLIALLAAILVYTLFSLAAPALQGRAIDTIKDRQFDRLIPLLLVLLTVYVLQTALHPAQTLLTAHLSQNITRRLRSDLFTKIARLPISYLDTHSSGDIMSRMTNDIDNISSTISQSLGSLISCVLDVAGTIAIMFLYCWQLTLITLISVALTVIVTRCLSSVMRNAYRKRSAALGELNGHAEEMITSSRTIIACNRQTRTKEEFDSISDRLTRENIRAEILGGSMGPLMNCISNITFVIVAAFGGYFAYRGTITIGVISAFIIYAKQFSRPINEIAQLYGTMQTAIAGAERVFALLDQPDEDNTGDLEIENLRGDITFRDVDFAYTPGKPVLSGFNLTVRSGQKIALVGATGSGKTTVVNLLMRFYPINAGEILIDGVNIRDLRRDWLRKNTAIVLQDTVLFSDTAEGNIRYGKPDASDEEMRSAARVSNCDTFISRMKDGYRTFLKQAGAGLSQGQRQLLTIARAVLADPKILILDEATSSVDTRTEQSIQDALTNLMKNRTSLIIAHRLSTIQDADVIVVLEQGHVVETGTHEELLQKRGAYYRLYNAQFAGNQT